MALGRELADREAVEADLHHGGVTGFGMGSIRFRKLNSCMQPIVGGTATSCSAWRSTWAKTVVLARSRCTEPPPLESIFRHPFTGDDQNPIAIPGMVELVIRVDVLLPSSRRQSRSLCWRSAPGPQRWRRWRRG